MRLRLMHVLRDEDEGEGGFVREIVVEGADRGLRLLSDRRHGDCLVAQVPEELLGGLQKAGATELCTALLRAASWICRSRGHPHILGGKRSRGNPRLCRGGFLWAQRSLRRPQRLYGRILYWASA